MKSRPRRKHHKRSNNMEYGMNLLDHCWPIYWDPEIDIDGCELARRNLLLNTTLFIDTSHHDHPEVHCEAADDTEKRPHAEIYLWLTDARVLRVLTHFSYGSADIFSESPKFTG